MEDGEIEPGLSGIGESDGVGCDQASVAPNWLMQSIRRPERRRVSTATCGAAPLIGGLVLKKLPVMGAPLLAGGTVGALGQLKLWRRKSAVFGLQFSVNRREAAAALPHRPSFDRRCLADEFIACRDPSRQSQRSPRMSAVISNQLD